MLVSYELNAPSMSVRFWLILLKKSDFQLA
ncbi:hypothetical protein C4K09_2069 [Pseudomonas chlororaphis subsp. aureofaciens]|nr:hypothetical protein C4K09_2069 [Pseudomonas chlororaphis subsp. aureofaciens]